jgi:type I restriction enzyme, S subunit
MVPEGWTEVGLGELEAAGALELGRGQVISKDDLRADPGPNPVYSSSGTGDGLFGRRGGYMFDED